MEEEGTLIKWIIFEYKISCLSVKGLARSLNDHKK